VISFRYHLITIVAVFLALGLGLLAGTTVLDQGLVNNLRRQTEGLRSDLRDLQAEVGQLRDANGQLQRAGDILPILDRGLLSSVPVVVVTQQRASEDVVAETRRALEAAHADVVAVLTVTDRMALPDAPSRQALAQILGVAPTAEPQVLQISAADELAQRLAAGLPRRGAQPTQRDVLDELLAENFVTAPGITKDDVLAVGGRDQVVVVVTGGAEDPAVMPDDFMVPLVQGLVQHGATVAAGESATSTYPFVETLRSDGSIADGSEMVTVDDVDLSIGGAALVLGVERLLFLGQGGNYGVKGSPTDVQPIPPVT
jgi:hypothetical protein